MRSESISSSWIEGKRVTPKRLAIAEVLSQGPRQALDVVANVRATEAAVTQLADASRAVTVGDIVDLQRLIEPRLAVGLRTEQNWVGGPGWSPVCADFVSAPEAEVRRLVANLADFVSHTAGNAVVRAALAHAQFETVHPFVDGNGRTGRALIHAVLRRADALRNTIIPISVVFARNAGDYIAGLNGFRNDPPTKGDWVVGFANAAQESAGYAVGLAEDIAKLDRTLFNRLISYREPNGLNPAVPRRDAVILRILKSLAQIPVLTVESAVEHFCASPQGVHRALTQLSEAQILSRTKNQRGRLICWAADDYLSRVELT